MLSTLTLLTKPDDDTATLEADFFDGGLTKTSSNGALLPPADVALLGSSLDHSPLGLDPLDDDRLNGLLDRCLLAPDLLDELPDGNLLAGDFLAELLDKDLLGEPLGAGCLDSDLLVDPLGGDLPGNDLLNEPLGSCLPGNDLLGEFSSLGLLAELSNWRLLDTDLLDEILGTDSLDDPAPGELLDDLRRSLPDDLLGDPSGEAANPGMMPSERELLGGLFDDDKVPSLESDSCLSLTDLGEDLDKNLGEDLGEDLDEDLGEDLGKDLDLLDEPAEPSGVEARAETTGRDSGA
jgi:hypothetical protein